MADPEPTSPKRLVLCFDGTGNKFVGDDSDTNIVKIYRMLDRTSPDQYHYYQPGIGTYAQNMTSNSSTPSGLISRSMAWMISSMDKAVGTSFVHHVLAGYQFLMRYYSPGNQVYIFGFSRGAYTARFLAEMIHNIGLLSKGNEEMVHFAWTTFSDYQTLPSKTEAEKEKKEQKKVYMDDFNKTFCRPDVNIHFLGLFDCVNSVGQFEIPLFRKSSPIVPKPPATYVRHAVSINERRLKFKPALFQLQHAKSSNDSGLKEMWFSGNHGDVGGGWEPQVKPEAKRLLSDIPLKWMILEIEELKKLGKVTLAFDEGRKLDFLNSGQEGMAPKDMSVFGTPHDHLAFGSTTSWYGVLAWWLIEIFPLFTRLELHKGQWVPRYWPPNYGAKRDIPDHAEIHDSQEKLGEAGVVTNYQIGVRGGDGPPRTDFLINLCYALPSLLALGILGAGAAELSGYLS